MEMLTNFRLVKIVEKSLFPELGLAMSETAVLSPSTLSLQIEIFADLSFILLTLRKIAKVLMIVDWQHVIRKRITAQSHASIGLRVDGLGPFILPGPAFSVEIQTFLEIDGGLTLTDDFRGRLPGHVVFLQFETIELFPLHFLLFMQFLESQFAFFLLRGVLLGHGGLVGLIGSCVGCEVQCGQFITGGTGSSGVTHDFFLV